MFVSVTHTSWCWWQRSRQRLKCDGTRAETKFRLSTKWTSPFKSAGASVQSTTDRRGVRISDTNAGYTMFRGSVKSTGYPFHSPVSPSLPLPCVTVCHHISSVLYFRVYDLDDERIFAWNESSYLPGNSASVCVRLLSHNRRCMRYYFVAVWACTLL